MMTSRALASILLASLALAMTISCGVRAGNVVLFPMGFEGWVMVHYEVSGAPAFEREGGKTLIRVPSSGSVSSSNERPTGYGLDEYYSVAPGGKRLRLQSEDKGCRSEELCVQQFQFFSSPSKVTRFFVGQKENLGRYPMPEVN
jgi:hypothetical protein